MDPFSIGLAAAQFGASALGAFGQDSARRNEVNQANKQKRMQYQHAMQNWQYNEEMRQIQQRQAEAKYEMRKQEYQLQKQLDYDAYKEFFEDSQLNFNNLIRDVKLKSFQSANKLAAFQSKSLASAFRRGAVGNRAGRSSANAAIMQGMEQRSRVDKLLFAEQQMEKGIERNRRRTDLKVRMAHNRVGPAPERLPSAPMPLAPTMQQQPSQLGLFSDLAMAGISAAGTLSSLTAPKPGTPNQNFDSWFDNVINEPYNPFGGSKF